MLSLALLVPYIWMGKLTTKAYLDASRAKSELLFEKHFKMTDPTEGTLIPLNNTGGEVDAKNPEITWFRFTKDNSLSLENLPKHQRRMIESLKDNMDRDEGLLITQKDKTLTSNYVRIFRTNENCISCHNARGTASEFSLNEPIGAVVVSRHANELTKTAIMNRVWIIAAGLIGGAGAIIAFYMITQRVILKPIRQLRALANNVAEGNLDVRSAIKTRDEYEKLSDAFNHMLDGLQAAQQKQRDTNQQLDKKIVELSERNIELFKANKLKSEFLANISHEFKTPLNAILGFAQILREKPGTLKEEKGQRYAENIITGGKRLLNMINDLLDLAKTEAGKMKLHIEQFDLQTLCKSSLAEFSPMTKEKKIKTRLVIDDTLPTLVTDAGKVQQILYNFLSNAIKFTEESGRIEIKVNMAKEKVVRISVTDNGCGISPADQKVIFEKFRQADGSLTRQSTGSGLGLAISRELAAMLAGEIGIQSEPEKGSTFWLEIPTTLTSEQEKDNTQKA
ncbi:MAG TPA: ATP-binding protein [Sedimentisphaerales bacterium]|nr:ATP-binding protein [Sedimentisphaerales bacterium]